MSAIVSRSAQTWAATHRVLLALVTFAIALAATVVIALVTSSGSSPNVQAPDQGQTGTVDQGRIDTPHQAPTGALNQGPADAPKRCLQYMGVRPC